MPIANPDVIKRTATREAALALLLCALSVVPAKAQESQTPGEAIGQTFESLHFRNAQPAPADFVRASRTNDKDLDYVPLTRTIRDPDKKKKTEAEFDAVRSDLESALARNRRAAARVSKPDVVAAPVKKKSRASN